MCRFFGLVVLILLSGLAVASELPNAPSSQPVVVVAAARAQARPHFWTPMTATLVAADAFVKSYDMWSTMWNAGRYKFVERDPLARPFVHSGPVVAGGSQAVVFAAELFTSYELHKHGHPKLARGIFLIGIGGNVVGIATSTH